MQTEIIHPDDIRYNAADQQFEARVTLHGSNGSRTYACAVAGDLSLSLDDAAIALRRTAIARHHAQPGLYSTRESLEPVALRAPARSSWHKPLLSALPLMRQRRAA